jgi:hypothetical protein
MGFNTSVIIFNDSLHVIEEDKEFGKTIVEAIRNLHNGKQSPINSHFHSAGYAIETHHADQTTLVAFGGNEASVLLNTYADHSEEGQIRLLKELASKLGYNVSKKPVKK